MVNYNKLSARKMKMIKRAMEKLQRSFNQLGKMLPTTDADEVEEEHANDNDEACYVPKDVKEGHFAVVAMDEDGGVARRFVVPLRCLTHPLFIALLERSAEEYGFDHRGALTIPCHPREIEMILGEDRLSRALDGCTNWKYDVITC